MFEPSRIPRVFACPPGADFPQVLVDGLLERLSGQPPQALARVELIVNTRRMRRRILRLFDSGPPRLLPRIRLVSELALEPTSELPRMPVSPLRIRFELAQLIARLLDREPDIAPRAALYELADSLASLVGEMHDEGVQPDDILSLDVADLSGHWARSLKFLEIATSFLAGRLGENPDHAARQRQVVEWLSRRWESRPPAHPVIIAGSTGSRATTSLLMQSVARLPQGAVILPGFDFEQPDAVWERLDSAPSGEDHPQFRFRRLMRALDLSPGDIRPWHGSLPADIRARNRLVSLALRPAPVTGQWMSEGPALAGLAEATGRMTLVEAPSPRQEAAAIAAILRQAAEEGRRAALVTPDRTLTRRVKAALERWRILPDISAGEPLHLTAPGRLFLMAGALPCQRLTSDRALALLKHPLVCAAPQQRKTHLERVRRFELALRRNGPAFPSREFLMSRAEDGEGLQDADRDWAIWVCRLLFRQEEAGLRPLAAHFADHLSRVRALVAGPDGTDESALWSGAAGQELERVTGEIAAEAAGAGNITAAEYLNLFRAILERREAREQRHTHPDITIWGTLEARVQGADLVILGGLNEGIWPEQPAADPWLNREMRHRAGLLLPERRIGLAAHDFQQAVAAGQVVLSRAVRDEDAQAVPSRWLNRLCNLLRGASEESAALLEQMRARGQVWLDLARTLELPDRTEPPAPRPAPRPPRAARPQRLSVTSINRLIRDPYAIYARHILGLEPLAPLRPEPDPLLRGSVLHLVMERFIRQYDPSEPLPELRRRLMQVADAVLKRHVPWLTARVLWRSRLEKVADSFLADEQARRAHATPVALEVSGRLKLCDPPFTLTARADRIDRTDDGEYVVYDYKSGPPPSKKQMRFFDKQLILEALILRQGGFDGLPAGPVAAVEHVGLGAPDQCRRYPLRSDELDSADSELRQLLAAYGRREQGYTARRAVARMRFSGDYDHLARYGEWDETCTPEPLEVGHEP